MQKGVGFAGTLKIWMKQHKEKRIDRGHQFSFCFCVSFKLLRKVRLSNFGKLNGNRTEDGCKRDRVREHPYQHVCDHSFHTAIRFLPLLKILHQSSHFLKAGDISLHVPFQSLPLPQKDKQYGQSPLLLLLLQSLHTYLSIHNFRPLLHPKGFLL